MGGWGRGWINVLLFPSISVIFFFFIRGWISNVLDGILTSPNWNDIPVNFYLRNTHGATRTERKRERIRQT